MEEEITQPLQPNKKTKIWFLVTIVILILVLGSFLLIFSTRQKPVSLSPPAPTQEEEFPTSEDFNEVVGQLDTPQKLIDHLNKNFSFEAGESDQSMTPEEFFKAKKGKRNDVVTFSSFVLFQNGYFATIFRYKFIDRENKEGIRTITLFREKDVTKYIDLEGSKLGIYLGGSSPVELLELEEKRYNVKIIEYAAFTYGSTDLSEADWLPR